MTYNSTEVRGAFARIRSRPVRQLREGRELAVELVQDIEDAAVAMTPVRRGYAAASIFHEVSQGRDRTGRFTADWVGVVGYNRNVAPHGPPIETGTGIYGPNKRPYLSHLPDGTPFLHPGMEAIRPIGKAVEATRPFREAKIRAYAIRGGRT